MSFSDMKRALQAIEQPVLYTQKSTVDDNMNKHRAKERERHSIDTRDWDRKGCESSRTNKNIRTGMIFYRCTAVWKESRSDFYGNH